jgi:hypothetical protein
MAARGESSTQAPAESRPSGPKAGKPDFARATHFELEKDVVWAWIAGARVRTGWRSLAETESAFRHVILLRTQRNILLNPEAVEAFDAVFGGRAKIRVAGNVELSVGRNAANRLKELLGI